MFTWNYFTFKISKSFFMLSKSIKGQPSFKNQMMATNWMNLLFFSLASQKPTTIFWHMLAHSHSILACWLLIDIKYCPTISPRHATLPFPLLACFYKLSNLGNNRFSFPSSSLQILQCTMLSFPSHPTTTSTQGNFISPTSWKTRFNSHSFFMFFFCVGSKITT